MKQNWNKKENKIYSQKGYLNKIADDNKENKRI